MRDAVVQRLADNPRIVLRHFHGKQGALWKFAYLEVADTGHQTIAKK